MGPALTGGRKEESRGVRSGWLVGEVTSFPRLRIDPTLFMPRLEDVKGISKSTGGRKYNLSDRTNWDPVRPDSSLGGGH